MATKKLKHQYIQGLGIIIMVLALVRCVFPGIGTSRQQEAPLASLPDTIIPKVSAVTQSAPVARDDKAEKEEKVEKVEKELKAEKEEKTVTRFIPFPPLDYATVFNDSNHVQLEAAQQWGVPPVKDRSDAEQRSHELVFMGSSPYYDMAHLDSSIPYLVPHAALLLQDIGIAFTDSLLARHMPMYQMVVSSVLRSEKDVARLRTTNRNATENSCHLYATTFDINYSAFTPVGSTRPMDEATEIKLKNVLGQVLYDMRSQGRCYVKHERLQPCFHITVR